MFMCEMMRYEAPSSWRMYSYTVTRFSASWLPFSFSVGPVDPSVENPGKNTAFLAKFRIENEQISFIINY